MKLRKNKVTNFLKTGILFFGISLLLWNCEKDNDVYLDIPNQTLNNKAPFESISFEKIILEEEFNEIIKKSKADKYFDESNTKEQLKSSDNSKSFEIIKESVNKIKTENYTSYTFQIKRNVKTKEKYSFENLIIEKRNDSINAIIIKYIPSEEYIKDTNLPFSGKMYIKKVDYKPSYLLKEQDPDCIWISTAIKRYCSTKDHGYSGATISTCSNFGKSEYVYARELSCFNGGSGTSFEGDDEITSFTDPSDTGGSEGYENQGTNTGVNPPCGDIIHTCDKENPVLGADCRSFEYAQPPGALQKGAAVLNFDHTFISLTPSGGRRFVDSNVPIVYFTAPPLMTNSRAANLTAIAVTSAIKATDIYYAANPYATEFQVGDFFRRSLQSSMKLFGGSISTTPPFTIRSPAPYITYIMGIGNPIDC